jgi:Mg2+ and Co2+ transporter CorA
MLYKSSYLSLIVQVVTGLIGFWGVNIKVDENKKFSRIY